MSECADTLRTLNQGMDASTVRIEVLDGLKSLEETVKKAEDILTL